MQRSKAIGVIAAIVVAAAAPPGASARDCRSTIPSATALAAYDSVVLVEIDAVQRTGQGANTWLAEARALRPVQGGSFRMRYTIRGTQIPLCNATYAPRQHDHWVLYLDPDDPGSAREAYPLSQVRDYDKRLKRLQ